jgi:hypothetical protein
LGEGFRFVLIGVRLPRDRNCAVGAGEMMPGAAGKAVSLNGRCRSG